MKQMPVKYRADGTNQYTRNPVEGKNTALLRSIASTGSSAYAIAKVAGVSPQWMYSLISGTVRPVKRSGTWSRSVLSIAHVLGEDPEDLFPDYAAVKPKSYKLVDMYGKDTSIDDDEVTDILNAVLSTLPRRQREVLELLYGISCSHPRTLDECGRVFGVTRERIRQVEAKALRLLRELLYRCPSTAGTLRDYLHIRPNRHVCVIVE